MNTNGSIYNAIMKAADFIERSPKRFNYISTSVPDSDCGSPGCAIGWTAYFRGMKESTARFMDDICVDAIGVSYWGAFVNRMDSICGFPELGWRNDALVCARILRLYAAKYHAPEKPAITGIPDSIRAIFVPGMRVS